MHLIITHNDADGWICGYLINKYIKEYYPDDFIHNYIWNYGQDYSKIERHLIDFTYTFPTHIWMTDITLPDEFMEKYAQYIHHFDHHESRIDNKFSWTDKLLDNQSAITISNYTDLIGDPAKKAAACELVWRKLFDPENNLVIPKIVRHVGRFDVWDNNDDTFAIHEYMKRYKVYDDKYKNIPYLDPFFKQLFTDRGFKEALKIGHDYLYYDRIFNAERSIQFSKIFTINNKKIIVGNPGRVSSTFYNKVVEENPDVDGILTFYFDPNDNNWKVSCYSIKNDFIALDFLNTYVNINVSFTNVISIGGHKNACGCVISNNGINSFVTGFNQ